MTVGELFELLSQNPSIVLFYFIAVPLTAFLALIFGKDEGTDSPWKYLYSTLVYLICIPGIFAVTLNIYLFLFERISLFEANIYTQVLPIFSMILTLWLIRKNVCFEDIPGFGKLHGLILVLASILSLMWVVDRTHIIAITFMPFYWVFIIFGAMTAGIWLGWNKFFSPKSDQEE
jgi:hypothetical protein